VVTESEFRRALRRGYVGNVVPAGYSQKCRFDPIRLDSPATVSSTARQVLNPDLQLGAPVSVTWNTDFLARLQSSQIVETLDGAVEIHALLPLIRRLFSVSFSESPRAEMFRLEMSNDLDRSLLAHFDLGEIAPPSLTDVRVHHGESAPTSSPTPPIGGPLIDSPTAKFEIQTLDRLSGAAELLVDSLSGAAQTELLCAVLSPERSLPATELSSDLHAVRWRLPNSTSLLSAVCTFILKLPPRMTLSPLAIEEKLDLVRHLLLAESIDQAQRPFLDELLRLVRTGEGLNHLLTKTNNLVLQSLVIFMSNNRDPREVADLKATHFGIDGAALALCAFLTGLRYPREVIPRDLVWPPLRTADIQDFVSMVNGQSVVVEPTRRLVEVAGARLTFNGEVFSPRTQVEVLELSRTSSLVRIRSRKATAHWGVAKIVVRNRSHVLSYSTIEVGHVRSGDEAKFVREIDLQHFKETKNRLARWSLNVFSNRSIDQFIEKKDYVKLKIKEPFWIELTTGERKEYRDSSIEVPLDCLKDLPKGIKSSDEMRVAAKPTLVEVLMHDRRTRAERKKKLKKFLENSFKACSIRF
jgi:hypothetical protein